MTTPDTPDALLAELAAHCGIEPHYTDNAGRPHLTSRETTVALLTAMGLAVHDPEDLRREVELRRARPWTTLVPPVQVLSPVWGAASLAVCLPLPESAGLAGLEIIGQLRDEGGDIRDFWVRGEDCLLEDTRPLNGRLYGRLRLPPLAPLPWGYYHLQVEIRGDHGPLTGEGLLISAPDTAFVPEVMTPEARFWGLTVPLYALRSRTNWGIGDLGDLAALAAWSGEHLGAAVLGVNPLHHPGVHLHDNVSPYYPISRLYKNPLYLDLTAVPELDRCPAARDILGSPAFQEARRLLQTAPRVDYPAVYALKRRVWSALYDTFAALHGPLEAPVTPRGQDFARYCRQQNASLGQFAVFTALCEHFQDQGLPYHSWHDWPAVYHTPDADAVRRFAAAHSREVELQLYLQWLLQEQLEQASAAAARAGMPLGLYFDLAVGIGAGGCDTWAHPGLFALTADIGAPPDDFNPLGQNWGLSPLIPERLRATGYRYLRDMIRQNSSGGAVLRLDHVMGLFRLFWIPRGQDPTAGAYVRYDWRELLAVVALESHRQRVLIIGEDLGTVPPFVRTELGRAQVLSTRLFYFERTPEGGFAPPDHYPEMAAAAVTTHDLPTLAGFWAGRDLATREQLRLYPSPASAAAARAHREQDKRLLAALFFPQQAAALALLPDLTPELRWRLLEFLAGTPCRLVLVSLEEVFGWLDQQNLPGTVDAYPNWRLKLPLLLEDICAAPDPHTLAALMRRVGRASLPAMSPRDDSRP